MVRGEEFVNSSRGTCCSCLFRYGEGCDKKYKRFLPLQQNFLILIVCKAEPTDKQYHLF
jgi:hypothetical protein